MDLGDFGDKRSLWMPIDKISEDVCVRPISGVWMLLGRLLVNISSIWEVLWVFLSGLGCRLGFDLISKINVKMEIRYFMESMLSPAWEHYFLQIQ